MRSLQDFIAKRRQDGQDKDFEHGARRRAQGFKSCLLRVDGSSGQDLAGSGAENQAVSSQRRSVALPLTREEPPLLFQELPDQLGRTRTYAIRFGEPKHDDALRSQAPLWESM